MKKGGTSEEMQTTCHILYYATFKSPLQISCHLNPPPKKKTNKKNNPETSSTPGHILQSPVPLLPDSCLQAAATWRAPWKGGQAHFGGCIGKEVSAFPQAELKLH